MKCKNHLARDAPYTCKRCSAAICGQCRMVVHEGSFCSRECIQEFRDFQSKIWTNAGPRRRITLVGLVRYFITVAILLCIIAAALYLWLGTTDPEEMFRVLRAQWKAVF